MNKLAPPPPAGRNVPTLRFEGMNDKTLKVQADPPTRVAIRFDSDPGIELEKQEVEQLMAFLQVYFLDKLPRIIQ